MKLNKTLLALAISTLLLSACSDTDEKDASLTDGSQNTASGIKDASTSGLNKGSGLYGSEMSGSGMGGGWKACFRKDFRGYKVITQMV